jgi:hypothetical protein
MAPMLYSARLESQTDEQWRRRTVLADSAGEARKLMERREDNRAAYSITARRSLRQIETRRHADGVHALVNLDPFATPEGAAEVSGRELLSFLEQDYHVEATARSTARVRTSRPTFRRTTRASRTRSSRSSR